MNHKWSERAAKAFPTVDFYTLADEDHGFTEKGRTWCLLLIYRYLRDYEILPQVRMPDGRILKKQVDCPWKPVHMYNPEVAEQVVKTAKSYYENRHRLIYSGKAETFLSGAPLYDEKSGGKGNIDCSTFIHLMLQGIPYEKSPYAIGKEGDLKKGMRRGRVRFWAGF